MKMVEAELIRRNLLASRSPDASLVPMDNNFLPPIGHKSPLRGITQVASTTNDSRQSQLDESHRRLVGHSMSESVQQRERREIKEAQIQYNRVIQSKTQADPEHHRSSSVVTEVPGFAVQPEPLNNFLSKDQSPGVTKNKMMAPDLEIISERDLPTPINKPIEENVIVEDIQDSAPMEQDKRVSPVFGQEQGKSRDPSLLVTQHPFSPKVQIASELNQVYDETA